MSSKSKNKLAIVLNLTDGGAPKLAMCICDELKKKSTVDIFSPNKFSPNGKNKIVRIFQYIYYIYVYLRKYYLDIGKKISREGYSMVLVFQDSYIKTPHIFKTLSTENMYIFADTPREFYENIFLHANSIFQIIFTYTIRLPVYFIDKNNIRYSKKIIAISRYTKDLVEKIYNKRSVIVYPGLRLGKKRVTSTERIKQCLSMGSLFGYKGHDMVIKSLGRIKRDRPSLIIIGNGSRKQKNSLYALAVKHGVQLKIKSSVSDNELKQIYRQSMVYVNGAYCEPFGMTSLEAVAHGCVLVTNDTGGTKELKAFFGDRVEVSKYEFQDMADKIEIALRRRYSEPPSMKYFEWSRVLKEMEIL